MDTRFPPRSPRSESEPVLSPAVTKRSRYLAGALTLLGALALSSNAFADKPTLPAPGKTKIIVKLDSHKVAIAAQDDDDDDDDAPPAKGVKPADKKDDKAAKADAAAEKKEADKKEAAEKKEKEEAAKKEKDAAEEKIQKGVVTIERAGTVLGIGTVLSNDGRILTALSPIGTGNDLEIKYADGTTAKAKVGHHDRTWDLALLVPQSGKWKDGLQASTKAAIREDAASAIKSFSIGKGNKLTAGSMVLKSIRNLLGADDKQIDNVIELGSRVVPTDLGSPILDEDGKVLGMLGRGCAPSTEKDKPCTPVAFGVPLTAIKSFLKNVPATAVMPAPWLGIQGIPDSNAIAKGVRVLTVHPDSPAEGAKLKGDKSAGDLILAVAGTPVTSPDSLADAIKEFSIGDKVPLLVFSGGKYKTVNITLKAAPDKAPTGNAAELPAADESSSDTKKSFK
jgi:serine protease Do